jgi:ParB family chromosome partitioning protein
MTAEKPRRLGRGLEALIPGAVAATSGGSGGSAGSPDLQRIPVTRIRPNPFQPRREFDPAELAELQSSMQASGLLQPITVRRKGDAFELIAGERRLRAATNLGWTEIQAIVRDFDEKTMLVLALVENLQRTDLNAIEEARGYQRLIEEFHLTQQQVADAVGKDRTTVTNLLRMLSLPDVIQSMVASGRLTAGHARALLPVTDPKRAVELAKDAEVQGSSVRELEQRVRAITAAQSSPASGLNKSPAPGLSVGRSTDSAVRSIEDDLRRYLQTDVKIALSGESKGEVRVSFYSNDDLDRVLELILREQRKDF